MNDITTAYHLLPLMVVILFTARQQAFLLFALIAAILYGNPGLLVAAGFWAIFLPLRTVFDVLQVRYWGASSVIKG